MTKILFICKKRSKLSGASFGLFNSAKFVAEALSKEFETKVVAVVDNNNIDFETHSFKPDIVIIEALWVVPSKFPILIKKYPKIHWIVRLHSKMPFLAMEGIAMHWLREYKELSNKYPTFHISCNSEELSSDILKGMHYDNLYLPNIVEFRAKNKLEYFLSGLKIPSENKPDPDVINISCAGAIRPFKNSLSQAFAAIEFAESINKKLRFYVNSDRTEQKGEEVVKNLRHLFPINGHELVECPWMDRETFLKFVSAMDIGMQVSFTETFNIVAADFVTQNVPIVVSKEINWMPRIYKADPNSRESMVKALKRAWFLRNISFQSVNYFYLKLYNYFAKNAWLENLS